MKLSLIKVLIVCLISSQAACLWADDNVTVPMAETTEMAINENDSSAFVNDNISITVNDNVSVISVTDNLTAQSASNFDDPCGQTDVALVPYRKQFMSIISENDAYYNTYTDRYYTAGTYIGYTSKEQDYYCQNIIYQNDKTYKRSPLWWLSKVSVLQGRHLTRWDISVAQEMYTPKNKFAKETGENDYPYAGYLYLALGFSHRNESTSESFKLHVGVVGPAALAQYTQDFIHTAFGLGSKLPWESQLSNEPIFNLNYQLTKKYYIFNTRYFSSDILPSISAALGNAHIYVAAGARLRVGYNLDADFGVSKINHAINSPPPHSDKLSIYAFGGAGGQFVIHNIFINGNTLQKGTNLEITRFLYEIEAGVAIAYKGFRASYTFSHRSKEFKDQANFMNFSSIALHIAF